MSWISRKLGLMTIRAYAGLLEDSLQSIKRDVDLQTSIIELKEMIINICPHKKTIKVEDKETLIKNDTLVINDIIYTKCAVCGKILNKKLKPKKKKVGKK